MRLTGITTVLLLFVTLLIVVDCCSKSSNSRGAWQRTKDYASGFKNGAKDMNRAYSDMKESDWKYSDKYFHARGNYDAAQHGTGGRHAAKVISDAREVYGFFKGDSAADRAADQRANEHGRNGGDPNIYRPRGLPKKYKK